MGPDALPRVGALLHEEADDVRSPAEHGCVKRSMLVVLRDVHVHELGASGHHRPHGLEIAVANGLDEPPHRDAVDECLQLRPAVKAVGARHDELRVTEGEGRRSGVPVMGVHFLSHLRIAGAKSVEQFLGLPLELQSNRVLTKRTGRGRVAGHDELLFRLRQTSAAGPVSAHSGRKEGHLQLRGPTIRGTPSFPRTRRRPECATQSLERFRSQLQAKRHSPFRNLAPT